MSVVQTSIGFPWHLSFKIVGKIVIFADPSVKSNFVKSKYNWSLLAMVAIRIHVLLATNRKWSFIKASVLSYILESCFMFRKVNHADQSLSLLVAWLWRLGQLKPIALLTVQLISRANQSTYFFQNQYWLITSSISSNWDHYMVKLFAFKKKWKCHV